MLTFDVSLWDATTTTTTASPSSNHFITPTYHDRKYHHYHYSHHHPQLTSLPPSIMTATTVIAALNPTMTFCLHHHHPNHDYNHHHHYHHPNHHHPFTTTFHHDNNHHHHQHPRLPPLPPQLTPITVTPCKLKYPQASRCSNICLQLHITSPSPRTAAHHLARPQPPQPRTLPHAPVWQRRREPPGPIRGSADMWTGQNVALSTSPPLPFQLLLLPRCRPLQVALIEMPLTGLPARGYYIYFSSIMHSPQPGIPFSVSRLFFFSRLR